MSPLLEPFYGYGTTRCTSLVTAGDSYGTTPVLSTTFSQVVLSTGSSPGAILLKKKVGEEIATLLPPPSFDGTDKTRAPFMAQSGGLA